MKTDPAYLLISIHKASVALGNTVDRRLKIAFKNGGVL